MPEINEDSLFLIEKIVLFILHSGFLHFMLQLK